MSARPAPKRDAAPALVRRPTVAGAPPPEQLHLQFGADAAHQLAASWAAPARIRRPRLRLGTQDGGLGSTVQGVERPYVEALTGETVWTYHAPVGGLEPDTEYLYDVSHHGSTPVRGSFRTAPVGRTARFRFTSFGDMGVPSPVGSGVGPWSPESGHVVGGIEAAGPLFHLLNGDLCYANVSDAPVRTWSRFFGNITRSARRRPWMPCAGNHENEVGNGPHGYLAYQTRFFLPDNGARPDLVGNWYAFTVGAMRVISINADDFCIQDGGFSTWRSQNLPMSGADAYIRGYSGGTQLAWLETELAEARGDESIDWVVVCMHQVAMSSAQFNGADLGIRRLLLPLLDRFEVDLVVAGHEHHYERSHPVRGVRADSSLLTPDVTSFDDDVIDTTKGRVHLTIGVGGSPTPSPVGGFTKPPRGLVICDVGPCRPGEQRVARKESEPADWLATRAVDHPYGFTSFDVDPGRPGGKTRIHVTHFGSTPGAGRYRPVDRFTLERPRRDLSSSGSRVPPEHQREHERAE